MAKRLNVLKISSKDLAEKWEIPNSMLWLDHYYVRCNSQGEVKWHNTLAYSAEELIERDNVYIHNKVKRPARKTLSL